MVTDNITTKKVVLWLLKDFSQTHTITSLASKLNLSRVGIWKVLKKLAEHNLVEITPIGSGKTSTFVAKINLNNILVEKMIALYLTQEAMLQMRWRKNFAELEQKTSFCILYGSILHSAQEANDIDVINVSFSKGKFIQIQQTIDKIQKTQHKKIHAINFTDAEFTQELLKKNPVFIDAIKKGVILFGQENLIKFLKKIY